MSLSFEFQGEWYLPDEKHKRVSGILKFDHEVGAILELHGNFYGLPFLSEEREKKEVKIILGETTEGKKITLHKCILIATKFVIVAGRESGTPTVYKANYLLTDVHVKSVDELKFNSISCEIHNLDEWLGESGFDQKMEYDGHNLKKISVDFTLPDPIDFHIDDNCDGKLDFAYEYSPSLQNYIIKQNVRLEIDAEKELGIKELRSYILKFQNFLILAFYRQTFSSSVVLMGERYLNDNGDERKRVQLFFKGLNKPSIKFRHKSQMIFDYQQVKDDFPVIIKKWYAKYLKIGPAFNLLFQQFYIGNKFTVNTFLNLAQSVETFHARIHNHPKMPIKDYKLLKKEIKKNVPEEYQKWLDTQFEYGNNLNLHTRLTEMLEKYSNEITDKIIGDKEQFVLDVKNSRNYYTHYSKGKEKKALKEKELYYLSEKMKLLLVCAFLAKIGFTKDKLTESLKKVEWVLFNHLNH